MKILILSLVFLMILSVIGCDNADKEEGDKTPPKVVSINISEASEITDNAVIIVTYSEQMNSAIISVSSSSGTTTLDSTGKTATWKASDTSDALPVGVHKITLDGKDMNGNRLESAGEIEFKVVRVKKEGLIIPGKQAASIKLGDTKDTVREIYGEPEAVLDFWVYQCDGIDLHFSTTDLVDGIWIYAPNKSKTADGNGIGSTLASVEKEFGQAEEIKESSIEGEKHHWYWSKGIEIDIVSNSKVSGFFIFEPNAAAPAGSKGMPQYNQELKKEILRKYLVSKTL